MRELLTYSKFFSSATLNQPTERLRIYALGETVVLLDGNAIIGWGRARTLELFFYLWGSKQSLRKDHIIGALWSEVGESEILNQTFRSTVYCIRQALGDSCLIYQDGRYQLNVQTVYGQIWYDIAVFEEYEHMAQTALEQENDQEAEQKYKNMIDLYRGRYAEAFYLE
jgi:two-component SAPR family response regulator